MKIALFLRKSTKPIFHLKEIKLLYFDVVLGLFEISI